MAKEKVKTEVGNILEVFRQASPVELAEGVAWYTVAKRESSRLAETYSVSLVTAAGIVAALSPRNKWKRNLVDAENLLRAFNEGTDLSSIKVCTFGIGKNKAIKILTEGISYEEEVAKVLSGPKMKEFFSCIMGDSEESCIDGHAFSVWKGERIPLDSTPKIGKGLRKEIKADYAKAGKILGIPASAVQAVTWVVFRRIHGIV